MYSQVKMRIVIFFKVEKSGTFYSGDPLPKGPARGKRLIVTPEGSARGRQPPNNKVAATLLNLRNESGFFQREKK